MSPAAPCEGAMAVSFMIGLRLRSLGGTMSQAMDLPLGWSRRRWSTASSGPWFVGEVFRERVW